jgi:hypothetical protein
MEVGQGPNWECSAKEKKIVAVVTFVAVVVVVVTIEFTSV